MLRYVPYILESSQGNIELQMHLLWGFQGYIYVVLSYFHKSLSIGGHSRTETLLQLTVPAHQAYDNKVHSQRPHYDISISYNFYHKKCEENRGKIRFEMYTARSEFVELFGWVKLLMEVSILVSI
jgi:hypothetical protein